MYLEDYLIDRAKNLGKIEIVGGSPLFDGILPDAISINGFHSNCSVAAINSSRSDLRRVDGRFETILMPNPKKKPREDIIVPRNKIDCFALKGIIDYDRELTTYFSLILICDELELDTEVYGICGRASKWHHGDLEMWYMKNKMSHVNVHDPRPEW